jgi:hypothetical protein
MLRVLRAGWRPVHKATPLDLMILNDEPVAAFAMPPG